MRKALVMTGVTRPGDNGWKVRVGVLYTEQRICGDHCVEIKSHSCLRDLPQN